MRVEGEVGCFNCKLRKLILINFGRNERTHQSHPIYASCILTKLCHLYQDKLLKNELIGWCEKNEKECIESLSVVTFDANLKYIISS